jgi:hypothetical protein
MNCEILTDDINSKIVSINDIKLQVFEDGRVYRFYKNGELKMVENTANNKGYNQIKCNGKMIKRHRIISFAFLDLDINDLQKQVDHIDGQRINNNIANLRVVSHQQNGFNRTKSKGYCWNKHSQKYQAQIGINGKTIALGCFNTEDEARSAYLAGKIVYHQIN